MWIKIVSGQTDRDMESVNARNKKTESELMRASEIVCCIRTYVLTTTEKNMGILNETGLNYLTSVSLN